MDKWDGIERRDKAQDHDTLIQVVEILQIHVKNFDKHINQDEENFKALNRTMYIGIGLVMAIQGLPILSSVIKILSHGG